MASLIARLRNCHPILRLRKHGIEIATGLLFGGLAAMASFNYFHGRLIQPYTNLQVEAIQSTIHQGSPLVIRVSGRREIICAVTVARSYTDLGTKQMVHQEIVPAGFVPLGDFSVNIQMQLPPFMGPGSYLFRGMQINDCGDENISTPYPPVNFKIID